MWHGVRFGDSKETFISVLVLILFGAGGGGGEGAGAGGIYLDQKSVNVFSIADILDFAIIAHRLKKKKKKK